MIFIKKTDTEIIALEFCSLKRWTSSSYLWSGVFSDYTYQDKESIILKKKGKLRQLCILGFNYGHFKAN